MDQLLLQIGVGGALAWLIIKEVLDFLKSRKEPHDRRTDDQAQLDMFTLLKKILSKTEDLHEWHDYDDPNNPGSKVWYGTAVINRIDKLEKKINDFILACKLKDK